MKKQKMLKHLIKNGCVFLREGVKHSVFFNPHAKRTSTVPRHNEVDDFLANKICRDLGVDRIR